MRKVLFVVLCALAAAACAHSAETPVHTAFAVALPGPHIEGAIATKMVPALRDSLITGRVAIDSHIDASTPRPRLNVALCIDTSGSMEGKAISDARNAALSFLSGIKPGDGFSVVTFDSSAHVIVPATRMSEETDVAKVRAEIGAMRAQGTTALADGLAAAIQQVRTLYDGSRVNRVVIVSDGVPNDPSQLRAIAAQARASGISISALGLGLDYDELVMGDLAQTGGGHFKYIDDSSKIASYLGDELTRITRVSARNASLEIMPGPGIAVESVIGMQPSPVAGGAVQLYLGDVSLGSHRDVFFKLRARGRRDGANVELADVTFRYVGTDGASHEEHFYFGARASGDDDLVAKSRDDGVERAAKEAQQAADAIEAIRKAHDTDKSPPPSGRQGHATNTPHVLPVPAMPDVAKRDHARAMEVLLGD